MPKQAAPVPSWMRQWTWLPPDVELALARLAADGDQTAQARLIESHAPLLRRLAKLYARFGVPQADLLQEGTIGFLHALRRFDPGHGVRLGTYASWWARAAMQEHVVRSWSMVRLGKTAPHRGLFFALKKTAAELKTNTEQLGEDVIAALATRFRLPRPEVQGMALRLGSRDRSLQNDQDGRVEDSVLSDLAADGPTPEEQVIARSEHRNARHLIDTALARLPPREASIIRNRHLADVGKTLEAIGRDLGLSKARVRQLEQRAMARLRETLEALNARERFG